MPDNEVDENEGGLTLILKNIPPDKQEQVEEALVKLMDDFNLAGTFWSHIVKVKRKRKHRRIPKGPEKSPGIEGYISEIH